jgi:hypothetical protein
MKSRDFLTPIMTTNWAIKIISISVCKGVEIRPSYHQGESDRNGVDFFDGPQDNEAEQLDESEQVDAAERHLAEIDVVRLVFRRHKEK